MLKLDYSYSSVKLSNLKKYEKRINEIVCDFKNKNCEGNDYIGWYDYCCSISEDDFSKLENCAKKIRNNSQVLVVCGIGGSYLGTRAVVEAIKGNYSTDIEIVYLGNTFDERYTKDVLNYLKDKDFSVNVISKSGSTLETAIAFRLLKQLLEEKYGDKAKDRIYATTDAENGSLRKMVGKNGYQSFVIPSNVGGRYSVFTPVGLLPLAVKNINIREFVSGAIRAYEDLKNESIENNVAYQYASYRYTQYLKKRKKVELLASYCPYYTMLSEWWKQLFGESEGKNGRGLFPASVIFSTDLHSLGQYIQEGNKLLFVTQMKFNRKGSLHLGEDKENLDGLNYLNEFDLDQINGFAQDGTNKAHYEIGKVDTLSLCIDEMNEKTLGYLLFFFMFSCMISAYLLKVNPFNQPGVEFYKSEMKKKMKKE